MLRQKKKNYENSIYIYFTMQKKKNLYLQKILLKKERKKETKVLPDI